MKNIFKVSAFILIAALACWIGNANAFAPFTIFQGGTGSSTAAGARTNLGLGSIATYGVGTLTNTKGCKYTTASGFVCDQSYLTAEVDGSVTNEIQDLSLTGDTLSLTDDATTVDLSGYYNSLTDLQGAVTNDFHNLGGSDIDTKLTEEEVEDFVGGMLGGTETLIAVTYQDETNDIDFVVDNDLHNYSWANVVDSDITDTLTAQNVEGVDYGTMTDANVCRYDLANTEVDCNIAVNAGTDLTADLEEEAHASEHAMSAADTVFPADPDADKYLMWDDDPGSLVWADSGAGGGATTALDNLASVAINTSLVSDTDSTDDLGSAEKYWANAYLDKIYLDADSTIVNTDVDGWNALVTESTSVDDTATLDLTLTGTQITGDVIVLKDLVAGAGLSGGSNDVLPGADADITIAFDATELEALTWGNADGNTITWQWNLVANDPSITFGPSMVQMDDDLHIGADDAIQKLVIHDAGYITMYDDSDDTSVQIGPVGNGGTVLGVTGTINATALQEGGNDVYNSTEVPGGELGGTWASPTIDNDALDDQYYDSEADLTGLLDDDYVDVDEAFSGDITGAYNATDITESVLGVGGTDTVFPADPNADRLLMWDDDPGTLVWTSAGTGDVIGVGDCADGECFDGSADGGTYISFYDAQGAVKLQVGDVAGAITLTLPVATGTLLTSEEINTISELDTLVADANILTEAEIDASSELLALMDDETGTGLLVFNDSPTFADDIIIHAAGVKLTGDGDGALTILGLGDGFDEDITLNLDDTENTLVLSSSTGLTTIDIGTLALEIDEGKLTDSTIVSADIKNGTIVVADTAITAGRSLTWSTDDMVADAELYTDTKCIYWEDPTADDDFKSIWFAKQAATITSMWCESDQTVNMDLQVDDGTPADVDGTDLVCDSTPPEDTSMGGDATLASGDRLDVAVTSVSGTPTWVSFCWTFTYDD